MESDKFVEQVVTLVTNFPESETRSLALECMKQLYQTSYCIQVIGQENVIQAFSNLFEQADVITLSLLHLLMHKFYFDLNTRLLKSQFNIDFTKYQIREQFIIPDENVCCKCKRDFISSFKCFFCDSQFRSPASRNRHHRRTHPELYGNYLLNKQKK